MLWLKFSRRTERERKKHSTRKSDIARSRVEAKIQHNNSNSRRSQVKSSHGRLQSTSYVSLSILLSTVSIRIMQRWSNFLEMYNLWIKTLLQQLIHHLDFSENVQIPETWLRIVSRLIWCAAVPTNFSTAKRALLTSSSFSDERCNNIHLLHSVSSSPFAILPAYDDRISK